MWQPILEALPTEAQLGHRTLDVAPEVESSSLSTGSSSSMLTNEIRHAYHNASFLPIYMDVKDSKSCGAFLQLFKHLIFHNF